MTAPRYANDLTDQQHATRRAWLAESHCNPAGWTPLAQKAVEAANVVIRDAVAVVRRAGGRQGEL